MPPTPNEALARDIIPAQKEDLPGPTLPVHRSTGRLWSGVCFAAVLLAVFARPLLSLIGYAATSELHSYALLIPFVSAYLLYLRRDQLPKNYASDLSGGILFLGAGFVVLAFTYWLDFTGRALSINSRIVLLTFSFLCCLAAGGSFFLGRPWMRAAAFPLGFLIFMVPMPDAMADALETASKYASAEVANLLFHLSGTPFLRAGLVFQLPNIARPGLALEESNGLRRNGGRGHAHFWTVSPQKVSDHIGNVLGSLAQGWQSNRHHVEPIE